MKAASFCAWLLLLFAGCSAKRYVEYTGRQVWPVNKGAVADASFAVPVYRGSPDRPYRVIGGIHLGNAVKWKDRDIAAAARIAKDKGGEALLIRTGEEMSSATSAGADPHLLSAGETGGIVIKWKSEIEVRESAVRLEGFRAYLKRSYPRLGLDSNEALWEMVTEYVTWLGLELDSDPGNAALENALASLNAPTANPAKWLFKAALRSDTVRGPTTGERVIYGIATNSLSADRVVIASIPAGTDLQFSGVAKENSLSGEIHLGPDAKGFDGKAIGESGSGRILLNCQGQIANGPAHGTVLLLR